MSAGVQVCWEKAARVRLVSPCPRAAAACPRPLTHLGALCCPQYTEVEEKFWHASPGQYAADPKELVDLVDENTILVVAILGSTYTGVYEDVAGINAELEKKSVARLHGSFPSRG